MDRFIPSRSLIDFNSAFLKVDSYQEEPEISWETSPSSLARYRKRQGLHHQLRTLVSLNQRIFKFTARCGKEADCEPIARLWPCNPKKRPRIREDKTLDLPDFNYGFYVNPIDWGANDCLATSVANKVLIGRDLKVDKEPMLVYEEDRATAVHWAPNGWILALGSETGLIILWQIFEKDVTSEERCCSKKTCTITAIQWHPGSKIFAWGCSKGKLCVRSIRSNLKINVKKAHKGFICSLKYSPCGNYLCSSGKDAYVRIWKGSDYNPYMEIEMQNPSRAIGWHPWQSGLLAVGEGPPAPGSLSLWNVNTAKNIFMNKLPHSMAITALNFSPLTGELVLSQSIGDYRMGMDERSNIFVLASPDNITDCIKDVQGSVTSLLWNSDYTQLGKRGNHWFKAKQKKSKQLINPKSPNTI